MADASGGDRGDSASAGHLHRSGGSDQRLWLETIPDLASTARLHPYCLDCGAVRAMQLLRGRPMGYFKHALTNLKRALEANPTSPKLAQVHAHLIATALEAIPQFDDPYSMPFETQWTIFVDVVQRYRPDLDVDLLRRVLPRPPRKGRPAYIDVIGTDQGGGEDRVSRD